MKSWTGWFVAGAAVSLMGIQSIDAAEGTTGLKPTAEHQRLGYFVGNWNTEGTVMPSPVNPGGKFSITDKCSWFEGGFAVICNSSGSTPTGTLKSMGIMSYSADEKVYTYSGVDNFGMTMTTIPRGTRQGGTWTYLDESTMGGGRVKSRATIQELSPSSYTFKMEIQAPDGTWITTMESKSTRTQ